MTKLQQFLDREGLTQKQFGERIGVHQTTICRLCLHRVAVNLRTALEIEKATDGAVRIADLLPIESRPVG